MALEADIPQVLVDTDGYKLCHPKCWPPKTTSTAFYLEARGGRDPYTTFFGLQPILHALATPLREEVLGRAAAEFEGYGVAYPIEEWRAVIRAKQGRLPVRIRAVREGTSVPVGNVLLTCEATHPAAYWVPGWIETMLSRVWYPMAVCTYSRRIKEVIYHAMRASCDDLLALPYMLHDFGARGGTSVESACIGGAAHLVNFEGSDTTAALRWIRRWYNGVQVAKSVAALEHSVVTAWGEAHEIDAYANFLAQYAKPGVVVAAVSDSYDLSHAIRRIWGETLRQQVINSGAIVAIRPDSGDPEMVVLRTLAELAMNFGVTINSKGYQVLNHVRVVQGDGVTLNSIERIIAAMLRAGWSLSNIGAFGCGGALIQKHDRDTQQVAYKCCEITEQPIHWTDKPELIVRGVSKHPQDAPWKASKHGYHDLVRREEGREGMAAFQSVPGRRADSMLQTVFEDSRVWQQDFSAIRRQATVSSSIG